MGLDPQTHMPMASSGYPVDKSLASVSTRHMAQWESARLEAEARLSSESSLINNHAPLCNKNDSDYFLRIWNSQVGESFRSIHKADDNTWCMSSTISQGSSSNKCGSVSAITTELASNQVGSSTPGSNLREDLEWSNSKSFGVVPGSDSSSSDDMEDSSDTALQLLLDFPINNDMSFLEENSFICPL